jgi:hypothetical protein
MRIRSKFTVETANVNRFSTMASGPPTTCTIAPAELVPTASATDPLIASRATLRW